MDDYQEFRKDFMEYVKSEAAASGQGSCACFVEHFADHLSQIEVLPDCTPCFCVGTGKRNKQFRVDAYSYDDFDQTMTVIVADFGDEGRVLTRTVAEQLLERLRYFVDQSYNGGLLKTLEISTPCYDLVEQMHSLRKTIRKYRLILITNAERSSVISSRNLDTFEIEGTPAESSVWDLARLYTVWHSDSARQMIEIDFREYSQDGIPCLRASTASTQQFSCYLCIISGRTLADIYDKYGSALLEGNVRSFLSTKVAVNKKIRETILRLPERFFAYNNGISATASGVEVVKSFSGERLTSVKDFQIINGGQTTASLSNARYRDKQDIDGIYVQMKLTEIYEGLGDRATELVRDISRSSNSQNKVSDADFFSTHPFHVRMEQISRRLFARATGGAQYETKWFYERARGQYSQAQMRMTPTEKNRFLLQNPKKQVITKTDLAKVRNTWDGYPQIVSRGAQTNFMRFAEVTDGKWEESELEFSDKYFRESVGLVILFRYVEAMIPHQPWYEQGYRANVVTYSLALLRVLIGKQFDGYELDLLGIWSRQEVPESVKGALVTITEHVYRQITSDRPVANVTQWCKRDACWDSVKRLSVSLAEDIRSALITKEDMKSTEREARADQRIVSGLEQQTKVLAYTPDQWRGVMAFCVQKRIVTPDELIALRIVCQPGKVPTSTQSQKLLRVLERAESEGYEI